MRQSLSLDWKSLYSQISLEIKAYSASILVEKKIHRDLNLYEFFFSLTDALKELARFHG